MLWSSASLEIKGSLFGVSKYYIGKRVIGEYGWVLYNLIVVTMNIFTFKL